MSVAERLHELGIELPPPTKPIANYTSALVDGDHLYISGHVSRRNGVIVTGRVGDDVTTPVAVEMARAVAIDMLSTIEDTVGLDAVRKIVRIGGYIRSAPDFRDQPTVLNGASDLLVELFGSDIGVHSRAAVGVSELPAGAILELDGIVRIETP
jgi:enamine deaminase RidA (YjgF/YER057c/UK114 family)